MSKNIRSFLPYALLLLYHVTILTQKALILNLLLQKSSVRVWLLKLHPLKDLSPPKDGTTSKDGKVIFIGWNMMKIFKVLSVSTVKSGGSQILKLVGHRSLSLLATGKKPQQWMKEHAESEWHILACQTETATASALREGSVLQQMHQLEESERLKNRSAIKSLLRCTHILARNRIAHTTNFGDLVDLVVTCGGEDLKQFVDKAVENAHYTSKDAVVDFVGALGKWIDESLLARLQNARHFSLLADECTDITTIEELSVVCRWVENGLPVKHFIEIIPLKKADAQTIYETGWLFEGERSAD